MTDWRPQLEGRPGPVYRAIAAAIAEDVEAGRLGVGDRLPTHRDLARSLGVSIGAVTRAYGVAREMGLLSGEVGRGSFIRRSAGAPVRIDPAPAPAGMIDLSCLKPAPVAGMDESLLRDALSLAARRPSLHAAMSAFGALGSERSRNAGAAWLRRLGLDAAPERVVVCSGVQHAMLVIFAAVCAPGDVVCVESMTYPGMRALAHTLRLTLAPVALDGSGVTPESFERACIEHRPRALYCTPTVQTPTCAVMPEARRRRIAQIARRHGVLIVEDDEDLALVERAPRPLSTSVPELGVFLGGTAHVLAPGLRAAFLHAPPGYDERLHDAMRTTVWTAPPLIGEVASTMLERGDAERLVQARTTALAARRAAALEALHGLEVVAPEGAHALWLELPERWRPEAFVDACADAGVCVESPSLFRTGAAAAPRGVRLALWSEARQGRFVEGLRLCAQVARS